MIIENGALGQAKFSDDRVYRYSLERKATKPPEVPMYDLVTFLMLNPSVATAEINDPTVSKCCVYAGLWGAKRLTVVNAFGFRSTDPKVLKLTSDPIGAENDETIMEVASRSSLVVCAWGKHGEIMGRGRELAGNLLDRGIALHYLKLNKDGSPSHPLYLPMSTVPQLWVEAAKYAG